ncbi:uracil-DNA glycosylase family protein [Colwellia sp. 6_MG-2023]|uniref:uracil-DNA glycosylase family protein n=1 Tax=Colwellia sp. 6_MG-2023 TaxID=3062676 RepID=UPI0026E47B79|nr:uracil-DNA glycosylase family protein [Colwellia sp. 6_MG-2023]MDO6487129.1 uracil-DNA glycosylase family protein [Colwellia sp. 6_MG-2023]
MKTLIAKIKQCQLCENILPCEPNPVFQANEQSKILILGQAPGIKAHQTSIPFNDKSGDRLRAWLGVSKSQFYNDELFAILPMSFCYPGKGKSGDLPPLPLCADTWRNALLAKLTKVELTIILGKYAIAWHLHTKAPITQLAQQWQTLLNSKQIVLPHPSPRNNIWLKKNSWFEDEVIPKLQSKIQSLI